MRTLLERYCRYHLGLSREYYDNLERAVRHFEAWHRDPLALSDFQPEML
jgi:hypothetical protein